jgi:hypothetical protein
VAAHGGADRRFGRRESLRGRILKVMKGHAFAGKLYPVSRSEREVMGLKAYPSVADLPEPPTSPSSSFRPSISPRSSNAAARPACARPSS